MFKALVVQPAAGTHPGRKSLFLGVGEVQFHLHGAEHGKKITQVANRFKPSRQR
jgi:hypothetical protein